MRQVLLRDGRLAWVNDEGKVVRISSGMGGAEPGFGETPQSNLPPMNVYRPDARTRDLMARLPDADIVGLRGPGVVPGGEQASGGRRVQNAEAGLPPPGATYRPLAGAQVNNRGNIATVLLPVLTGGPEQIIPSIVETAKTGGQDAETITVQLGMELPQEFTDVAGPYSSVPLDVTAVVEWGVGGAFFSAEIDWNQGVCFPVCASFLRISARVGAIPPLLFPDLSIVLRASLAYGNSQSMNLSSSARRTLLLVDPPPAPGILAAGASSNIFPIPLWAMGLTLVDTGTFVGGGAAIIEPDYTIFIYENASPTTNCVYKLKTRTNLGTQVEGQFPIPAKGRFISITNNLGVGVIKPKALFNLGF